MIGNKFLKYAYSKNMTETKRALAHRVVNEGYGTNHVVFSSSLEIELFDGDVITETLERVAVLSRHEPTQEQRLMAKDLGFHLEWLGDVDAFIGEIPGLDTYDIYCVVHPVLSGRITKGDAYSAYKEYRPKTVIVFENGARPQVGGVSGGFVPLSVWAISPWANDDGVGGTTVEKLV